MCHNLFALLLLLQINNYVVKKCDALTMALCFHFGLFA